MSVRATYYLVSSLNWFANVVPMAVSVLFAQSRGLSLGQIGVYGAVYALTVVLLELPSGALADTFGRKRTYLLAGALALAAKVLFLLAFDLSGFVAYALLWGTARALSSGALEAWFVDALQAREPNAPLQSALAAAGSYNLVGLAAGTVTGAMLPGLFAWLPSDGAAVLTPLSATVIVSAVAQAAVIALAALLVREPPPDRGRVGGRSGLRSALAEVRTVMLDAAALTRGSRPLQLLLLGECLVGVALMTSETLWQPFFATRISEARLGEASRGAADLVAHLLGTTAAADARVLGFVLGGSFAMGVFGNVAATRLTRLLKGRNALAAGVFQGLQAVAFVVLAWQTGLIGATALFWLTYVTRSAWSSPHLALFNAAVPAARRSVMLSVLSLAGFAGSFLGSLLLAPLAQATSIAVVWCVCAGVLALGVTAYLALDRLTSAAGPDGRLAGPVAGAREGS